MNKVTATVVPTFQTALNNFNSKHPVVSFLDIAKRNYVSESDCRPMHRGGLHEYNDKRIKELLSAGLAELYYVEEYACLYAIYR